MRWIGLGVLMLFCCGVAAAEPAPVARLLGAPPIYREFRDWVLVCDNVRTCVARYPGGGNDGYLSFSRDPGPSGSARVTLSSAAGGRLERDGRLMARYPWSPVTRKGTGRQDVLEGDAARK